MNTTRLFLAALNHPLLAEDFHGVYASDQLHSLDRIGGYVINTDSSDGPGEHWVAVFVTPTARHYFDSLGMPILSTLLSHQSRLRPWCYTPRRVQGNSDLCGYYCIYFLLTMVDSRYSMNIFGDDYYANDRLIKLTVERLFNVTLTM